MLAARALALLGSAACCSVFGLGLGLGAQSTTKQPARQEQLSQTTSRMWPHFPALLWRQTYRNRPVPEALVRTFGGVNVEGSDAAEFTLSHQLDFYVGHGPGRNELHLERQGPYAQTQAKWYQDRDPKHLVRVPCLSDPALALELQQTLAKTLAARDGQHGLGISLGDEVSLTPWGDPADLCQSPTCQAAWAQHRQLQGLPEVQMPLTDDVRLLCTEGDWSSFSTWLDRRDFHHNMLIQRLSELSTQTRAAGQPVGLLGLAGRSAFGGLDILEALDLVDFIEVYDVVDARALCDTWVRDHQRRLVTLFPDGESKTGVGLSWQLHDHWMRGGDGAVIWSDKELEQRPQALRRLSKLVARLRLWEHKLAMWPSDQESTTRTSATRTSWNPRPRGVAVVHHWPSLASMWMRDALLDGPTWPNRLQGYQSLNGSWEVLQSTCLDLLRDIGCQPGAVPLDRIGPDLVERFPLLVFGHVNLLEDEAWKNCRAYLEAGGQIVLAGQVGELGQTPNSSAQVPGADVESKVQALQAVEAQQLIAELTKSYPNQVHSGPAELSNYNNTRLDSRDPRAERTRREMLQHVLAAKVPRPPFELNWIQPGPDSVPFRLQWTELSKGNYLCAALPNLPRPEQRAAHSGPFTFAPNFKEDAQVQWLSGPASEEMPEVRLALDAGRGLLFRIQQ